MAIALLMLLISCSTTKVEYKVYIPTLDFPVFPHGESARDNQDGTCEVPSEWVVRVAEFENNYEAVRLEYEDLKKLFDRDIKK